MKSKNEFKQYIKEILGEPLITVEVTDSQLNEIVQITLDKFSEYAVEGREKTVLLLEVPSIKESEFQEDPKVTQKVCQVLLDERITEIANLKTSGNMGGIGGLLNAGGGLIFSKPELIAALTGQNMGMATDSSSSMVDMVAVLANVSALTSIFNVEPNFDFNSLTGKLTIFQDLSNGGMIMLDARLKLYCADDDTKYRFLEHQWIKKYAVALAKKQWGHNIGKFDQTLISGARLNYDRMIQEATAELELLETELLENYCTPLGVIRA